MQLVDIKAQVGCGGHGETVTTVGKVKLPVSMGPCPSGCGIAQLDRNGEIHTPTCCPSGVKNIDRFPPRAG
jgi:hypothetical protein